MSTELDSLIRMARWGREQGKRNIVADLAPLCEIADEVERLRGELEVALANRQAFQDDMLSANSRLADENSRLRAELAAAKAEPPRPAAIMANPDGDIDAFEDMRDYHAMPQPRGSWGYTLRSWTWHPKSP